MVNGVPPVEEPTEARPPRLCDECDRCGDADPSRLYALLDRQHYCVKCLRIVAPDWPVPAEQGWYEHRRAAGSVDHAFSPTSSSRDIDRLGLAGETAFADRYGLPRPKKGAPDRGYDQKLPGGTIDVKTTDYRTWKLICCVGCRSEADYYVLCRMTDHVPAFIGWTTRARFRRRKLKWPGKVMNYVAEPGELEGDVDGLVAALKGGAHPKPKEI